MIEELGIRVEDFMAWDKAAWKKAYAKKNRKKMNAYARKYYHEKNREKHIALVQKWKKKNPDKLEKYKKLDSTPEGKEKLRKRQEKYRNKNREQWRKNHRRWRAERQKKYWKSKIIIENAVERRFGCRYWIDKEGNLCETEIERKEWQDERKRLERKK